MIDVSNNQLNGTQQPSATSSSPWTGVAIQRQRTGTVVVSAFPQFFEFQGSLFALSNFRLRNLGPVRESQVTVQGNQMLDGHNGAQPMVIVELTTAGSSCLFLGNQCRLLTQGLAQELVRITAGRIVAGNNIVRRAAETDAMRLLIGPGGQATVIGNLTFGNIQLEPDGLPPEFQALNLLSP